MKMFTTALLAALTCLPSITFAARTIKVEVNGMVCAFCAVAIEKKMKSIPATKDLYINLSKKIVAIELKDGQDVALEAVAAGIRESGYEVRNIARSAESLQQIRAAAK